MPMADVAVLRPLAWLQMVAFGELPVEARLKRLVACMHSAAFMQRYRSDLDTREARRKELATRWYDQNWPCLNCNMTVM